MLPLLADNKAFALRRELFTSLLLRLNDDLHDFFVIHEQQSSLPE